MNKQIEQVLSGSIHIEVFLDELRSNQDLQNYIRDFIPLDATTNAAHDIWKIIPYESLRRNDFDYYKFLFWALHSNNRFGNNLSIFSRLQRIYLFYNPDFQCTNRYEKEFDLYLDVIQDCFEGPEVQTIVEHIVSKSAELPTYTQQKKCAKAALCKNFHIEGRKRPHWIQGPEWPMGSKSPMAYVLQKHDGDLVQFFFKDVDTGETKIIEQAY